MTDRLPTIDLSALTAGRDRARDVTIGEAADDGEPARIESFRQG